MPTKTESIRSLRQAGAALKARRQAAGLSQKELADLAGTGQSRISDVENAYVSVSLDLYLRLLEHLDGELAVRDRIASEGDG